MHFRAERPKYLPTTIKYMVAFQQINRITYITVIYGHVSQNLDQSSCIYNKHKWGIEWKCNQNFINKTYSNLMGIWVIWSKLNRFNTLLIIDDRTSFGQILSHFGPKSKEKKTKCLQFAAQNINEWNDKVFIFKASNS